MADLIIAGGKTVGAAFLLLSDQSLQIKLMAVINIAPVFICPVQLPCRGQNSIISYNGILILLLQLVLRIFSEEGKDILIKHF